VFAIHLVTSCLTYGKVEGQQAIVLLLDELAQWLGEDRHQQIEAIRFDLLGLSTAAALPTVSVETQSRPLATPNETDSLIERFYEAYQQKDWGVALALLNQLAMAEDLPRLFDLVAYRREIQRRTGAQYRTDDRNREYQLLKLKTRIEPRDRIWADLKSLWQVYPGYDPEGLADWIFEADSRYLEANRRIALAYQNNKQTLNLNDLGLEVIPRTIAHLQNLQWLSAANNLLAVVPTQLAQLTQLEIVHFEHNHIANFPVHLAAIPSLQAIYLKKNRITYLPAEIGQLRLLEILDLRHNELQDLPPELAQLHRLSVLVLDRNLLTALPSCLFTLNNLTWLLVADNEIREVPDEIEALQNLRLLSLSHNALRDLPLAIGRLPRLETLFVTRGNPLDLIPRDVVNGGGQVVLSWLREKAN
jgi:Leucine-rich repeat (LRR) protein